MSPIQDKYKAAYIFMFLDYEMMTDYDDDYEMTQQNTQTGP
jgi:hypothetical protein